MCRQRQHKLAATTWETVDTTGMSVQVAKAREALAGNLLTRNIQLGCFTVKTREGNPHAVQLFPKETCTCPSTTTCYHILACKMSLGMAVEGKRPAVNLTRLRSNARKQVEKKCGRKQPRPEDVIPAPDSEEGKGLCSIIDGKGTHTRVCGVKPYLATATSNLAEQNAVSTSSTPEQPSNVLMSSTPVKAHEIPKSTSLFLTPVQEARDV